jgi:hypothetical protein
MFSFLIISEFFASQTATKLICWSFAPYNYVRDRRGRMNRMVVGLLPMQPVPITTNVMSSNPTHAIQAYVIKFLSDIPEVGGFLRVLQFPPPIKLTALI